MAFCIPKHLVNDFLLKLKSGEINPEKLSEMTSAKRREFLAGIVGEFNAPKVNALFESKLLLKNQQLGIINWAKKIAGLKPEAARDMVSRVSRMEKILEPETADAFLADLAAQRLGVTVTMKEAATISTLVKDVKKFEVKVDRTSDSGSDSRMDYGRAAHDFTKFIEDLKIEAKALDMIEYVRPENWGKAISNTGGFLKSAWASLDNSAIGRQGWRTLWKEPDIWVRNSLKTFKDAWDTFGGKDVMREIKADIVSRENAMNGLYKKQGLAVGVKEEAFPTSLPEKIPFVGRAYKASETMFQGFAYRTRVEVFDRLAFTAEKTGAEIEGLGTFVNSLTGRGHMGAFEPSANAINNLMFSARFLRSNIDGLTGYQMNKMSPFVRKQGAEATIKSVIGIAVVLKIADALAPGSVEWDSTSTDFGQIKIGNTRFDVTGGMRTLVILASRLMFKSIKSSTTGVKTKLNEPGYYSKTREDVMGQFARGKFSPLLSVGMMLANGKTYHGDPLTPGNVAFETLTPLSIRNAKELYDDPRSANIILSIMAETLGISTNTWGAEVNWLHKTSKEMIQMRELFNVREGSEKAGEKLFLQANKDYNNLYADWLERAKKDKEFLALSDDDKWKTLSQHRSRFKKKIFIKYNFKPRREKSPRLPRIK